MVPVAGGRSKGYPSNAGPVVEHKLRLVAINKLDRPVRIVAATGILRTLAVTSVGSSAEGLNAHAIPHPHSGLQGRGRGQREGPNFQRDRDLADHVAAVRY